MDGHSKNEEILFLLRSKNRCLDRLMEATRVFLREPIEALVGEAPSETNPLSAYETERATIIRTLEMHDRRINDLIGELLPEEKQPSFLDLVRNELHANERLIASVFNADDIVFRKIREAQSILTRLMTENRKSRDLLSKFKSSTNASTGEEMDRTL